MRQGMITYGKNERLGQEAFPTCFNVLSWQLPEIAEENLKTSVSIANTLAMIWIMCLPNTRHVLPLTDHSVAYLQDKLKSYISYPFFTL